MNLMTTENKMQKIDATSVEAQSADLMAANIEQLKALFPELITESSNGAAVNVDVLKALVGDKTATDADEKYGLNWHGKRRARQLALTPSTGTLRPCPEDSVDWDTTQNLMIEGDNLEVLKLLQKSYAGEVKLIYIDPPYNTGSDFVYPDNFHDNIQNYLELTGQVQSGLKISTNTEASGRFHTDWLNMIYPRLKLSWTLLRADGFLLVSIDDKEFSRLRTVLDELCGEEIYLLTCGKSTVTIGAPFSAVSKSTSPLSKRMTRGLRLPDSLKSMRRGHFGMMAIQAGLAVMVLGTMFHTRSPGGHAQFPVGAGFGRREKDSISSTEPV
jgi:adenine-specific DNA-methyltransferase